METKLKDKKWLCISLRTNSGRKCLGVLDDDPVSFWERPKFWNWERKANGSPI